MWVCELSVSKIPPEVEIIRNNRFKVILREIGPEKFKDIMYQMYAVKGMDTISVGNLLHRSDVTVADWLRRLGIQVKKHKYKMYARLGKEEDWRVEWVEGEQVKTHVIVPDENLARLTFFVIGDGSVGDYTVQVHQANRHMFSTLLERMKRYGTIFVDYYANGKKVTTPEEATLGRLTLNNSEIARLIFDERGIRFDTIRFCLMNRKLAAYAIASFWDADGSLPAEKTKSLGFRAEVTQSHDIEIGRDAVRLLNEIRNALEMHWKIRSVVRLLDAAQKTWIYEKQVNTKPRYILHINQNDLPKFARAIGNHFEHLEKRERAMKILRSKEIGFEGSS